jgi:hypothetical protein
MTELVLGNVDSPATPKSVYNAILAAMDFAI